MVDTDFVLDKMEPRREMPLNIRCHVVAYCVLRLLVNETILCLPPPDATMLSRNFDYSLAPES